MAHSVANVDALDALVAQADHFSEATLGDQVDRRNAKPRRQNPIERGRRTAALDVPQHADSHFLASARSHGIADAGSDRAGAALLLPLLRQRNSFGYHDDGKTLAVALSHRNMLTDFVHGEWNLGD